MYNYSRQLNPNQFNIILLPYRYDFTFRSLLMRIALPYLIWGGSAINVIPAIVCPLDVVLCESLEDTNTDISDIMDALDAVKPSMFAKFLSSP